MGFLGEISKNYNMKKIYVVYEMKGLSLEFHGCFEVFSKALTFIGVSEIDYNRVCDNNQSGNFYYNGKYIKCLDVI